MGDPLDLIRELNRRRKSSVVETPLDLIRQLNEERKTRMATDRILKRVRGHS